MNGNVNAGSGGTATTARIIPHISWGALFSGTIVVFILQLTLALLGLWIGLASVSPATQANPLAGLGTGSAVWLVISAIISLFFGGWVASRFSGVQDTLGGMVHGILTWGLSTALMLMLLTGALGSLISGGMGVMQSVAAVTGGAAAANPQQTQETGQDLQQKAQQDIQNMTPQQRAQLEQQARQRGEQATKSASKGAAGSFWMLVLGGIASAIGGASGRARGLVRA